MENKGVKCPDCDRIFDTEEQMLDHYPTHYPDEHPCTNLLFEDEKVIRELESGWQVVKHGRKFEWSKSMFRFELLRKPLLTNKRLILLKGAEVDYEFPIEDIESAEEDTAGAGNIYLRIELRSGNAVSLAFTCVSPKMMFGPYYLLGKSRSIVKNWEKSINDLVNQMPINPLMILKTRYAKGEITKEEYEQMKKTLESE